MGTHSPGKLIPVTLNKLPDGWHGDGGGLYLFVRGPSRAWVFRYTGLDGKRKNMGLGGFESLTLANARKIAAEMRQKIKHPTEPIDPQIERKQAKAALRIEQARRMTFKQCAEAFIESKRHEWKNPKHVAQWSATLGTYAYPVIGNLPVGEIDTPHIIQILGEIWTTKNETASRLRGRIANILDWAKVGKYRTGDNPAAWTGHLENLLAKPSKVQTVKHFPALPYRQIGAFMIQLRAREGSSARALEFAILTAARSGEVRGATWAEIDFDNKVWVIPAERMKAKKEHLVPLTARAIELLRALPRINGCEFVFPSSKPGAPLSDMSLTTALRRMGHSEITVHGFRSTFRDWAGEVSSFPREVIEHALAHQLADKAEAAYQRGTLFDKRRLLMDAWVKYCGKTPITADVIQIKAQA